MESIIYSKIVKHIDSIAPEVLIATDPPSYYTLARKIEEVRPRLLAREPSIDPIFVTAYSSRYFLILDGHCRSYLLADRNLPITGLVLHRDSDKDIILAMEKHGDIPPFPHREYLMGHCNLSHLIKSAKQWAYKTGFLSVKQLLSLDLNNIKPSDKNTSPSIHKHLQIRPQSYCVVVYDRKVEHYLPIKEGKLPVVKRLRYNYLTINDPVKIAESVSWAQQSHLDPVLLSCLDIRYRR